MDDPLKLQQYLESTSQKSLIQLIFESQLSSEADLGDQDKQPSESAGEIGGEEMKSSDEVNFSSNVLKNMA